MLRHDLHAEELERGHEQRERGVRARIIGWRTRSTLSASMVITTS
jgi:hypothetical protein